MKTTNMEIARAGLCTEGAVRAAISKGKLDVDRLESVVGFVLAMRMKQIGLEFCDDLAVAGVPKTVGGMVAGGYVKAASELHYELDGSQEEGEW